MQVQAIATGGKKVKTKRKLMGVIRRNIGAWILLLPFVCLMISMSWLPTLKGILWSFFEMNGYNVESFAGLDNYRIVLGDTQFLGALWNTVQYVGWSLVIGYWLPVLVAVLLNEMKTLSGYFKFSIYFPQMAPAIAVSMLWYFMFFPNNTGLLNMVLAWFGVEPLEWLQNSKYTIMLITISNTWRGMGSTTLVYLAALQGVNRELYEAAMLEGAGIWKRVWRITLPQISGILLINFVRQIIGVFQIMEQPLAMTGGGPNGASTSLGLLVYRYAFQNFRIGSSLALNVVMFLMLVGFSIFYFMVKRRVEDE